MITGQVLQEIEGETVLVPLVGNSKKQKWIFIKQLLF